MFLIFLAICLNSTGQDCYQLVWSDEFDTPGSPDAAVWGYDLGNSGFGNREIQNYTSSTENARIENGLLIIQAKKTGDGWTSARLKSQGKKSFTYGRIEFRAKLPAGSGTWPALWMLGESISTAGWPACGEVDIMEHVGKDPGKVHASLHTPSSSGATVNTAITTVADFSTAFHVYAVDWTQDKMDFYVDNTLYYTYAPSVKNSSTWPFDKPCFIIMNVAMGGNWGSDTKYESGGLKNGIDPSLSSVQMEVDYVRYYSKTEKPKISGKLSLTKEETTTYSVLVNGATSYSWQVPADAQIISGQNTNQITVKWGTASGNVSVNVSTTCGNISANPLSVTVKNIPTAEVFSIPAVNSNNSISWEVVPTSGNTITLTANQDLEIHYDISQPVNNPCIKNVLSEINDFTNYHYIAFSLKCEKGNVPSVVRLDMIDSQNNNNQDNIFKVTSFTDDGQYHLYTALIASTAVFNLSSIKELRFYINYSIYPKGTGKIWLKEVAFYKQNPLSTDPASISHQRIRIFPNPSNDIINIQPAGDYEISFINSRGQIIKTENTNTTNIHISSLPSGVYQLILKNKQKQDFSVKFIKVD